MIHRMAEVGKYLWKLSTPSSLLKAGWAKAGSSGPSPVRFWIFPDIETPQVLWLFQCWSTTVFFFFLRVNFFRISSCVHCLSSCHWMWMRKTSSLESPLRYLSLLIRSPWAFSWALSASTYMTNPLFISVALCCTCSSMSMSLLCCRAQHWTQYSICVSPVLRREGSPHLSCWQQSF